MVIGHTGYSDDRMNGTPNLVVIMTNCSWFKATQHEEFYSTLGIIDSNNA